DPDDARRRRSRQLPGRRRDRRRLRPRPRIPRDPPQRPGDEPGPRTMPEEPMIWVDGKILPDDGLSISVLDRTFEHGLGLFETLRTWGGRPTLLEKHKARMLRSAGELKLPIDPASLPDAEDVRALLDADG